MFIELLLLTLEIFIKRNYFVNLKNFKYKRYRLYATQGCIIYSERVLREYRNHQEIEAVSLERTASHCLSFFYESYIL